MCQLIDHMTIHNSENQFPVDMWQVNNIGTLLQVVCVSLSFYSNTYQPGGLFRLLTSSRSTFVDYSQVHMLVHP